LWNSIVSKVKKVFTEVKALVKTVFIVAQPIVKTIQQKNSNLQGTTTKGINLSGTIGAIGSAINIGVSTDYKGNVAVQWSKGTSRGAPCASVTAFQTMTSAPSVDELQGKSTQIGGSLNLALISPKTPLSIGGEVTMFGDYGKYWGGTIMAGVGIGIPIEYHVDIMDTKTIYQFNWYDL
jgi:hypothetical protein